MRHHQSRGFTFVEMLTALALMAVLVAIAWGKFNKSYEKALEATLVTDLRNLATAQEIYYRANFRYSSDLGTLKIAPSPKSQIVITSADGKGWSAWNQIERSEKRCEIYVGGGHSSPLGIATSSERIACDVP